MQYKQKKKAKKIFLEILAMLAISTVIFAYVSVILPEQKTQEAYAKFMASEAQASNSQNTLNLTNTATETYIYTEQDLVTFRNNVNAGNNYTGKTVYLMNDIDLSKICSSTLGSWTQIGTNSVAFNGTFNGNYHKIKNLYIRENSTNVSMFKRLEANGIIENLILENVYVYNAFNTGNSNTSALASINYGTIRNCGLMSGTVTGYQTAGATTGYKGTYVGGLVAVSTGNIDGCYNKATVTGNANTGVSGSEARVGGVVGQHNLNTVSNCYNGGKATATGFTSYAGGVIGLIHMSTGNPNKPIAKNLYNYGSIVANGGTKYCGGSVRIKWA